MSVSDIYQTGVAAGRVNLAYQATENKGRRQNPRTTSHHEDRVLPASKRKKLVETARDQARNYSLVAWMIRRHTDYVSQFTPFVRTGNDEVNFAVKQLLMESGKRSNFDVRKRFGRDQAMRFFELSKVVDGDAAFLDLSTGAKQLIEGCMIGRPEYGKGLPKRWEDKVKDSGLVLDKITGAMTHACLLRWNERGDQKEYGRVVSADDLVFGAYYPRINSSRGVSPLSTALNQVADLYENFEFTLLKIKLHALFGIATTRDAAVDDGFTTTEAEDSEDVGFDGQTEQAARSDITLGHGVLQMNLDPGEKVETIESKTPNSEFITFSNLIARIVMLALDIPFTAFDSMQASFSARIADREEYEFSARSKRQQNIEVLNELTERDVARWAAQPDILGDLLRRSSMTPEDVVRGIKWQPIGMPWLDKLKEVAGDEKAIAIGIESSPRAAARRGVDAYEILQEQSDFLAEAERLNVPITIGAPGQSTVGEKQAAEQDMQNDA